MKKLIWGFSCLIFSQLQFFDILFADTNLEKKIQSEEKSFSTDTTVGLKTGVAYDFITEGNTFPGEDVPKVYSDMGFYNIEAEFNKPFYPWLFMGYYLGYHYSGIKNKTCYSGSSGPIDSETSLTCSVGSNMFSTGLKFTLLAPIPYFGLFTSLGLGAAIGSITSIYDDDDSLEGVAPQVTNEIGLGLGSRNQYQLILGFYFNYQYNHTISFAGFRYNMPLTLLQNL